MFCIIHVFTFKCGFTYILFTMTWTFMFRDWKKILKNRIKILSLIDKFFPVSKHKSSNWNDLDFGYLKKFKVSLYDHELLSSSLI